MRKYLLHKRDFLAGVVALPTGLFAMRSAAQTPIGPDSGSAYVALFKGISRVSVPPGTEFVRTGGFSKLGKGGARYKRGSGLPSWGRDKWWGTDASGQQWELAEAQPETDMFGTIGDATAKPPGSSEPIVSHAVLLATVSGTDVTQNIQDCVDFCLFKKIKNAILSEGRHLTSAPIHLGYGETFSAVSLIGRGSSYAPYGNDFGGSSIIAAHSNGPILAVQGARDVYVQGLTLYGLYANWVAANHLAANSSTQRVRLDDTSIDHWICPALDRNQDTRYTPFAAIAIDPYSGKRPAISYPDVQYPSWTRIDSQYRKLNSSKVTIQDVTIIGVIAGVAIQPADTDANGDFVELDRVSVLYSKYMVSAGNTQGRNVALYGCIFNSIHTLLEGNTHGRRAGRFQGEISNLSGSSCIQVLNVTAAYSFPIVFSNCYFEGTWRLGNAIGSGASSLLFSGCYFQFPMPVQNNTRGQPSNHFSGSASRQSGVAPCQAPVRFLGCKIVVESVFVLIAQDIAFDGEIRPVERDSGSVERYQAYAHNGLAGGLVVYDFADAPGCALNVSARYKQIDGTTGIVGSDASMINNHFACSTAARRYGAPVYSRELEPAIEGAAVSVRPQSFQAAMSTFKGAAQRGRVVTFKDTNSFATSERQGRRPGDVWIDRATGTVFFVTSHDVRTGLITVRQQNNWKGNAGAESNVEAPNFAAGEFQCISTRMFTPAYPLFVDSTAGSNSLTEAGTADANTAPIDGTNGPAVGDYFALNNYEDNMVAEDGTTITAMSAAHKTITMSTNANETQTRKRLRLFRAAPPANVVAP